jgi:O-antigen/teichoic acid export membrane protein
VGRIDFIVLSLMVSMKDVGMYSPPFKIYEIGLMVPSLITVVLFPAFSRCFESAREKFNALYRDMLRFVFVLGAPAVILLANASGFLIELIFGAEYSDGSGVLQLLAFTILVIALDQLLTCVTLAGHREDLEFKILVIACVVYLVLLFLMVSLLGYIGAAIATLSASLVKLVVRYFWIKKELRIPEVMHLLYRPLIAVLPLVLALYFLKDINIFLSSFLALTAYGVILFVVKGITMHDITSFRRALAEN